MAAGTAAGAAQVALTVLGWALVAASLVPLSRAQHWWVRALDFPRLQIAILLIAVGLAHVAWVPHGAGALVLRALMVVSLGVQARRMHRYTPLVRRQVQDCEVRDPRRELRLLFANVLQTNRCFEGLLAEIRRTDPDVVLALETDGWWQQQLDVLRATHPHVVLQPQDNTYGMLLYSRLPLIKPEVRFLVEPDIPSIHLHVRLGSGTEVRLHCLHPRPPAPQESDSSVPRDAELLVVGKAIRDQPGPVVVMGDMNDVAWSHTSSLFRKVSGLLDPRIGRGFFNSFHADHWFLRYPLDHFFHSNDFRLVEFCRLARYGSDHFPVYIHLLHKPAAQADQPEPQAPAEDRAEAREKIDEAGAQGVRVPD
ncbi:endonuclease/exonuclease/phosphatase family protein [Aquabacterium sp. J223]|uniref:endonuclease/exonuclease/phosphatase family protein n=1 Tax=Aquabacterium sp. J223 TaxID=2898431 RepID=UPI0021AD7326|nr:endonuclease/exonuclease/phosphatase family protein [Aquabacterium sp. J223]UUX97178.1 endonuclease/exonuclease/phosphatase family protein [Aquabacterium sp. J223]